MSVQTLVVCSWAKSPILHATTFFVVRKEKREKMKIKIDNLFDELESVLKSKTKGKKQDIESVISSIKKSFSKTEYNKEERRVIRNIIHEIDDCNKDDLTITIDKKKNTIYILFMKKRLHFSVSLTKSSIESTSKKTSKNKSLVCVNHYLISDSDSIFKQRNKSKKEKITYIKDLKTGTERWDF